MGDVEKAVFWIHNRTCRVLVFAFNGQVMDNDDSWNNLASAQCDVFHKYGYGITHEHVARSDTKRLVELNAIFDNLAGPRSYKPSARELKNQDETPFVLDSHGKLDV